MVQCATSDRKCQQTFNISSSGITRDSGAPRQIFKWGPPFFVIIFIIHTIPHDIRVEFKFKLKFFGVCCCNASTKHSMVWIVMPTFYCNYFFCLELGGPLHSGAPWTLPTLPNPLLRHWLVLQPLQLTVQVMAVHQNSEWNEWQRNRWPRHSNHCQLGQINFEILSFLIVYNILIRPSITISLYFLVHTDSVSNVYVHTMYILLYHFYHPHNSTWHKSRI